MLKSAKANQYNDNAMDCSGMVLTLCEIMMVRTKRRILPGNGNNLKDGEKSALLEL